ncbi:MAG TPA: DUF2203 domain-containing protein [Bryobacteraceae bacterium]|jgi:hypothetical protein|nr:DUF2203 domain-containing protein [Bryobacteraceae bacterium]
MPRFFTLQQAEQLLPEVESAIRDAIALKSEYQQAESEWQDFARRVTMLGGVLVDHSKVRAQKNQRESVALRLKEVIERIHDFGCVVKDLDIGLIDFPTQLHGEEVYLCWKLGESGIQFWHGVHEGFRGRKPIDQDFLQHHSGELPN